LAQARGVRAEAIGAGHDASRDEVRKQAQHRARVAQLVAFGRQGFDVAVSHVSYTQASAARHLGIPTFATIDYEHRGLCAFRDARCFMTPSAISSAALEAVGVPARVVRHYEGLKEHVYLTGFRPTPDIRERLSVAAAERLVVFRPIADHAVYTDDSGDEIQRRLLERLAAEPGVRVLLLPRTESQRRVFAPLACQWPAVRVCHDVLDGPSLICASDLVVCGGGTMLREAAVLGVPAVSIFPGRLGAIDQGLASAGRVTLVRSVADAARIRVGRRPLHVPGPSSGVALAQIVEGICDAANGG
jgi:hypothetical protein